MNRQHLRDRINYISELFESKLELFDTSSIPEIKAKGTSKVEARLALQSHFHYGETILYINELFNDDGTIEQYRYGWEYKQTPHRRISKKERHITAFDKQEHPEPPHNDIKTDPYHHHHVPGEISKRKETNVQSLEDVITILSDYIFADIKYSEKDSF